ncbi:Myosin-11 [Wickerhamomyces ciferrii]|uniref:Myosin-11 n=1 Tax=Wickerhamomyces ciferrii (strain ATCC 14091 / BCRC 22168 / CBS 111 / JCM 3599 / NBRC 0793 / NRRL Y-1031 F-60-10) TaxID=1206466 RepID=K0KUZ1_WICCF|nr:Myosin-11 [Wickerhamomyces ciferrii]CCH45244.1 Myosin-11 [Wickerhamomyces ciferrii]
MEREPKDLVSSAGPSNNTPAEELIEINTLIPRATYINEVEESEAAVERRSTLVNVLHKLPGLFDIQSPLSPLAISTIIDYTTWIVLVNGINDIKFDEKLLTKYLNNLMKSNIKKAVQDNTSSIITSITAYTLILKLLISQFKHFTTSDLQDSSLFTKLELLEIDLTLLRQGNLTQHHSVIQRVDRIFSLETVAFSPDTAGSRQTTAHNPEVSQHIDSSPPVDSSDSGDHEEEESISISKDSQPNILTQSTQLNALDDGNLTLASRVEVQATSSSNGTSQQSKDSQQSQNSQQLLDQSQREQQHLPDSTKLLTNLHNGPSSTNNSGSLNLKDLSNRITDPVLRNDLLTWGKNLDFNLKSFRGINNRSIELKAALDKLITLLEKRDNENSIDKNQDISIRSVDSSVSKEKESQDSNNNIESNGTDDDKITKVFIDLFEHRFSEISESTKIIDEKMVSLTESQILISSLVEAFPALTQNQKSLDTRIEQIKENVKENFHRLSQSTIDNLRMFEEQGKQNVAKIQETLGNNKELETKVNKSEGELKEIKNGQKLIGESIQTLVSNINALKLEIKSETDHHINRIIHNYTGIFTRLDDAQKVQNLQAERLNTQMEHIRSIQGEMKNKDQIISNLKNFVDQATSQLIDFPTFKGFQDSIKSEIHNLKLRNLQLVSRSDLTSYISKEDDKHTAHAEKVQEDMKNLQDQFTNSVTIQNSVTDSTRREMTSLRNAVMMVKERLVKIVESQNDDEKFKDFQLQFKDLNDKFTENSKLFNELQEEFDKCKAPLSELLTKLSSPNNPDMVKFKSTVEETIADLQKKMELKVDKEQDQSNLELLQSLQTSLKNLETKVESIQDTKPNGSPEVQTVNDIVNNIDDETIKHIEEKLETKISRVDARLKKKVEFDNTFLNGKFVEISSTLKELETKLEEFESRKHDKPEPEPVPVVEKENDPRIELLIEEIQSMKRNQHSMEKNQHKLETENKNLKERLNKLETHQSRSTPKGSSINAYSLPRPSRATVPVNPKPPAAPTLTQMNSKISNLLSRGKVSTGSTRSSSPEVVNSLPRKRSDSEALSIRSSPSASPSSFGIDIKKIKLIPRNKGN